MGCIWSADNLWPVLSTWVRHAGEADGEVRLVAGRTDPEGVWQYGRLEFRDRGVFVNLTPRSFTVGLGRSGAQVACRQLGFASGAEAIISTTSALPGPAGVTDAVSSIVCNGTEDTLGDCIVVRRVDFISCAGGRDNCNAALVCASPTGKPPELFSNHVACYPQTKYHARGRVGYGRTKRCPVRTVYLITCPPSHQ